MNILLLGSGARENALAFALAKSPLLSTLLIAPGNAGTAEFGENVRLDISDHAAVIAACKARRVDLVVIGPETPLVAGLVDDLAAAGIRAFGPGREAARLEGSKAFTKEICDEAGIPTARYRRFTDAAAAKAYIEAEGAPIVVKYDGLMAGKGVVVATTTNEANAAVDAMLTGPSDSLVIEECMIGEEASFFCISDGETVRALASAQDHKRVFDGDLGPNTGGMGAYSPAPVMSPEMEARALREIVEPTIRRMKERGTPYRGILFAGLMITAEGPKLIEYNCRFGDPECQVLMLRLKDDLLTLLLAALDGQLRTISIRWRDEAAIAVVMAAKGYPGPYRRGSAIKGLDRAGALPGVTVFHAGTKLEGGSLIADGGRVLSICATGPDIAAARARVYDGVAAINWPEGFCRMDIAWRALSPSSGA
jgi:phosphoribosylamine---glycine ligase